MTAGRFQNNGRRQAIDELYSIARAAGGGGAAAAHYAFVFRPGGVPGGNVFTTWATLYAATQAVQGPKLVQIDTTLVSPAVVPAAGSPYDLTGWTLVGGPGAALSSATLSFADGAHATWSGILYVTGNVELLNAGTTPTVTTVGFDMAIQLERSSIVGNSVGGVPFVEVADGTLFFLFMQDQGNLGGATPGVPAISTPNAGGGGVRVFVIELADSIILAGALQQAGGAGPPARYSVTRDESSTLAGFTPGTVSLAYDSGNTPPTRLVNAAKIGPIAAGSNLDFQTATPYLTMTGRVRVSITVNPFSTTTAVRTLSAVLLVDGAPAFPVFGPAVQSVPLSAGGVQASLAFSYVVTVNEVAGFNPGTSHTFGARITIDSTDAFELDADQGTISIQDV